MRPIKYETWIFVRDMIRKGTMVGSKLLEFINFEVPGLGLLLDFLASLLGWSLEKLWEALPHENEPRPDKFAPLPLWVPKSQGGKGKPEIPLRVLELGKIKPKVVVNDPVAWETIKKAINEYKPELAHLLPGGGASDVRIVDYMLNLLPYSAPVDIGVTKYTKKQRELAKEPGRMVRSKKYNLNPTFGQVGL